MLPENWVALNIFLKLDTQWRMIANMGGVIYQGLDYSAVRSSLLMDGERYPAYRFACLRLIERGALMVLNK